MADDNDLERTESATPQRLEKAREEGQVARSHELSTFAMLMAAGGGLWFTGGHLFDTMRSMLKSGLRLDAGAAFDATQMTFRLREFSFEALYAITPLLIVMVIVALAAPMLLSGWLVSFSALRVDMQRLDPISGLARLVSWRGIAELFKALIKAVLVATVAVAVIWHDRDSLQQLAALPLEAGIAQMAHLTLVGFLTIAAALAVVAAVDVPFQLWRHAEDLKMSREEVRQESKESEGNPEIKAAIRNQQRAMARRRMMAEVPNASVIITNPTHYAVALRYDDATMRAPRVVAKGADAIAAKIRAVGEEHRVPVLESPALARAMYRHAEIGDEIPAELYTAVAEVLAYVFQLLRYNEFGGATPQPPGPVAVPLELDPLGVGK